MSAMSDSEKTISKHFQNFIVQFIIGTFCEMLLWQKILFKTAQYLPFLYFVTNAKKLKAFRLNGSTQRRAQRRW